ncbi:MAG: FAD-dependent thymidylate synthase, partial [Candidatus Cloacimonetes bacterium]|nr:FAD-dependent thymidylate synthase [Candidatus Cloacimonadota bacterium]
MENIKDKYRKIQFTPETISAAYARISRADKSVDKLRIQALKDIERCRKSNKEIVFEMGHSSIAEHAVFNFDIIGISRYLTEFVQRTRLASFTEKSQRYITLKGDYVLPEEIKNDPKIADEFCSIIEKQNQAYFSLYKSLKDYYRLKSSTNLTKLKAKEDARYIISLATKTQMGMTINARSIERLLKRLYAIPFMEASELADKIYKEVKSVAPSLIRYVKPSRYDENRYLTKFFPKMKNLTEKCQSKLLYYTDNCDEKILTALLFRKTGNSWGRVRKQVMQMSLPEKKKQILDCLKDIANYDSLPREFEICDFTFQLNISASCFAQLKRHRMSTIIVSDYHPKYGFTIPESIVRIGKKEDFERVIKVTENFYYKLAEAYPTIKNYILTNAHHRLVLFKLNLRELCNFSRLREDSNAQWEIRELAHKIVSECKKVAPLTT